MILYERLGLKSGATLEAIKKAHRRLAMKLHPDKGPGNEEAFRDVQQAFDVLSDPELRARYDESGDIPAKELNSIEQAASGLIADILKAILHQHPNPVNSPILKLLVEEIKGRKKQLDDKRREFEKILAASKLLLDAKRFKRKGEGANRMDDGLRAIVDECNRMIAKITPPIECHAKALSLLGDHEDAYEIAQEKEKAAKAAARAEAQAKLAQTSIQQTPLGSIFGGFGGAFGSGTNT